MWVGHVVKCPDRLFDAVLCFEGKLKGTVQKSRNRSHRNAGGLCNIFQTGDTFLTHSAL